MRKLFFAILLINVYGIFAQTANMNDLNAKYWFYRWRLRNDFMVMGTAQGNSLVAEARNPERRSLIKYADATIMHGYYISMLAVENRLLRAQGRTEDLHNNERELYYAIKAFERLDYWSETIYSSTDNPFDNDPYRVNDLPLRASVNGYFFRDDVPPTFISSDPFNGTGFNQNHAKLNNGKTGITYGPMNFTKSDFEGLYQPYNYGTTENPNYYLQPPLLESPHFPIVNYLEGMDDEIFALGEESQDQLIRIIMGFTMIVKSIPDETFSIDLDKDGYFETAMNFHEEAKRHGTNVLGRLSGFMKGTNEVSIFDVEFMPHFLTLTAPGPRILTNPRHDRTFGGYIGPFKPPLSAVTPILFSQNNELEIQNPFEIIDSYIPSGFSGLWNLGIAGYDDFVNAKMALTLNCISNTGNDYGLNTVPRSIYQESKGNDKYLHAYYVPLYDYLWGWNPDSSSTDFERKEESYSLANEWLSIAPCVGPHNFKYSSSIDSCQYCPYPDFSPDQHYLGAPAVWNTPFLFDSEKERFEDGIGGYKNVAEGWFSGMDFMLLHNLIYANTQDERPMYHDLINRIVDYEIITNDLTNTTEYSANNLLIGAYENMEIKAVIHGNAAVDVKALDYVLLTNGAEINPEISGEITIFTDTITCDNTGNSGEWNVYNSPLCTTCNLQENIGVNLVPTTKKRINSYDLAVSPLSMDELLALESNNRVQSLSSDTYIYPNPAEDNLFIKTTENFISCNIQDQFGKNVLTNEINNLNSELIQLNIKSLPAGVYFLQLKNENNEVEIFKILKL